MGKRHDSTCSDCYFRQEGLCALATEIPCPTFRLAARGRLTPPKQAQLIPLVGSAKAAAEITGREREQLRTAPLTPAYA